MSPIGTRRLIIRSAALVAFSHAAVIALAQPAYPTKPVRILVGFVPGGFTDTAARILGQKLSDTMGQQVIVENRSGASGRIAAELTAKAAPDGYTLIMSNNGLTTNPLLFAKYPLDSQRNFTPVSLVAVIPNVLVAHPSVPVKSVKDLLALARARPATLTQASSGTGSPGHLSGELLQQMTQTRFVHVPYKGTGAALIDLVGGHVDLSFPTLSSGLPFVAAGKLRALGVTSVKRSGLQPELPTIAEAGVPGFEVSGWYGIVGPAGMPRDVVLRLSTEIARILKAPDVREKMLREGADPIGNSSDEFAAYIAEDRRKWTKVIKAANIPPI